MFNLYKGWTKTFHWIEETIKFCFPIFYKLKVLNRHCCRIRDQYTSNYLTSALYEFRILHHNIYWKSFIVLTCNPRLSSMKKRMWIIPTKCNIMYSTGYAVGRLTFLISSLCSKLLSNFQHSVLCTVCIIKQWTTV